MQKFYKRKSEGFTIVETLIVLAIVGVMMVVVFLAVPALNRNSRNNAAATNANNILAAVGSYLSNNGGVMPGYVSNPSSGYVTISLSSGSTTDNAEKAKVDTSLTAASLVTSIPATKPAPGVIYLVTKATCNDSATAPQASSNGRAYVVWYGAESGSGDIAKCIGS